VLFNDDDDDDDDCQLSFQLFPYLRMDKKNSVLK